MLRNLTVEVEGADSELYEVTASVPLPELKCGDTGHTYVVLALAEGNAAEPASFTCELKFQVSYCGAAVEVCGAFPFGHSTEVYVFVGFPACVSYCARHMMPL